MEAAEASGSAVASVADPRAINDATSSAAAYVAGPDAACEVEVMDFCLVDAAQVADAAGRWGFDFQIRVEANRGCGALTATLDLVKDGAFLGQVAVDGNDIIAAFNCECEKVFTVYADYDGAPGSFYGQIDIRNGDAGIAKIADSCEMDLPVSE